MVESGETTLSSQFVQLPDTPTNFHRPSTSRSTKLAKSLNPSPPTPPKRANPVRFRQLRIKDICLFYPPSFIPIPPLQVFYKISPSNSPQCQKIWSGFEIRALRNEFLQNIKFYYDPIRKIKYPNFHDFQRILVSPSNSPQCHRIWLEFKTRALKHKILLNIKFHKIWSPVRKLQIYHISGLLLLPPAPPDPV